MGSSELSTMEEGRVIHPKSHISEVPDFYPRTAGELDLVARYMKKDSDWWVFRRFGKLHLFNILYLQQRLAYLEHELENQIRRANEPNGKDEGFEKLYPSIQNALKEYDEAISAQAKFKSYRKPEDQVFQLLEKWSKNHSPALRRGLDVHDEGRKDMEDLASIAAIEKSWTHRFIDRHECLRSRFAQPEMEDEQLSSIMYYSEDNVRRAEAFFLHLCFCLLLLFPVFALSYVQSKLLKLMILVIFLFAASALTVGLLNASNNHAMGLVVGYAAILVVFLSNNIEFVTA